MQQDLLPHRREGNARKLRSPVPAAGDSAGRTGAIPSGDPLYDGSIVRFLWTLAGIARPARTRRDIGRRLEFFLRNLPFAGPLRSMRQMFLQQEFRFIPAAHPALVEKLRRPYLDRRWRVDRRLAALLSHYRWLAANVGRPVLKDIYSGDGAWIAGFRGRDSLCRVQLVYDRLYDKEGELMLVLTDDADRRVATLAFTVASGPSGVPAMYIGGLQGSRDMDRECYRQLTKDLHGLRPLALLATCAQWLAAEWGLDNVYGISAAEHVYRHWRYRIKGMHAISRSYDILWQDLGGSTEGGWYVLGTEAHRRAPDDIPANKRAMYVRRAAMMDEAHAEIRTFAQSQRVACVGNADAAAGPDATSAAAVPRMPGQRRH